MDLPGLTPAAPIPPNVYERTSLGKMPTPEHVFRGDDYRTVYTAEEVLNEVENRAHCRLDRLAIILFRKGIITGAEFLEAIHARDFVVYERE